MRKIQFGRLLRYFSEDIEKVITVEEISLEELNKTKSHYLRHVPDETEFEDIKTSWKYIICGKEFQAIEIDLEAKQTVVSRAGSLGYMSEGIQMKSHLSGGVGESFKRVISRSSGFLTEFNYTLESGIGKLMLVPHYPAKIIGIDFNNYPKGLMCHKDSYLCGEPGLAISANFIFQPLAGLGGGEGFILQKLSGKAPSFLIGGGVIIKKNLREKEEIRLSTGCLLAFDSQIPYKVEAIKGLKNILFGQKSLFFVKLTGPGDVYIQSFAFQKLVGNVIGKVKNFIKP